MLTKSVYVSYSWTTEKEVPLVDELGKACIAHGLDFRCDKDRLQHGDLIRNFMDELGSSANIIPLFSLSYFKSEYCMYELLQIWKNGDFQRRVHPIWMDIGQRVDDVDLQLDIMSFWQKKTKSLERKLEKHDVGIAIQLQKRRVVYAEIYHQTGDLLDFVSNMLITPIDELKKQKFSPIFDRINQLCISQNNNMVSKKEVLDDIAIQKIQIQQIDKKLAKIKSNYHSEYKDIVHWLSKDKSIIIDIIYDQIVKESGSLQTNNYQSANTGEIKTFKLDVIQFLEQFEVCLLDNSTDILDEMFFRPEVQKKFYAMAFFMVLKKMPDTILEKSKEKLKYYMDYLLNLL